MTFSLLVPSIDFETVDVIPNFLFKIFQNKYAGVKYNAGVAHNVWNTLAKGLIK